MKKLKESEKSEKYFGGIDFTGKNKILKNKETQQKIIKN